MVSEVISFSSVEQLESAAQATGWQIEYRQLQPGRLNAWFTSSEVEGINLSVEEFDNRLQVCCEPPQVFLGSCYRVSSQGGRQPQFVDAAL
jgi:hypothetical protein